MTENWKSVEGYEGLYEVSDRGRVRSLGWTVTQFSQRGRPFTRQVKPRVLKPILCTRADGYRWQHVKLYRDGACQIKKLGSLVAKAFIGPRPEGLHVAHSDGDGTHNSVRNLRYATPAANEMDKLRHGTHNRGERSGTSKLTVAEVARIRAARGHEMQADIASRYGISQQQVSKIQLRERWSYCVPNIFD